VVCSKGGHAWSPGIIAGLLVFNAAIGLHQESRAQATFAALRSRLALTACARRDGAWISWCPRPNWCPAIVVKLSLVGIVAAVKPIRFRETALGAKNWGREELGARRTGGAKT
jgi:hypothetical protein